jgi:hypothetical protein
MFFDRFAICTEARRMLAEHDTNGKVESQFHPNYNHALEEK